jgi:hypothetical protein
MDFCGIKYAVGEIFTPSSVKVSDSDGEVRNINCQSSCSKPRARHFLLKESKLALLSELILKKRKLYECILNRNSMLCKL